ncbi:Uu.00g105830.m01.CDS01 [Anthostomella pinea]|uniref:Uu.00g105830.m01.CDS01 n=1 Tax=Anthostomella pinea TaxID=933095 RepID=A0AAI8VEQ3_9PEZI|nr:Uu.00g105830.m01.CDS01 [Anthostomella pinea]
MYSYRMLTTEERPRNYDFTFPLQFVRSPNRTDHDIPSSNQPNTNHASEGYEDDTLPAVNGAARTGDHINEPVVNDETLPAVNDAARNAYHINEPVTNDETDSVQHLDAKFAMATRHQPHQTRYRGDPGNPRNQCAMIPIEESTCIWIENLPTECTEAVLLDSIRNCGKIYSLNIVPPGYNHHTPAAKLTFWAREGVDRLMEQYRQGLFTVNVNVPWGPDPCE